MCANTLMTAALVDVMWIKVKTTRTKAVYCLIKCNDDVELQLASPPCQTRLVLTFSTTTSCWHTNKFTTIHNEPQEQMEMARETLTILRKQASANTKGKTVAFFVDMYNIIYIMIILINSNLII